MRKVLSALVGLTEKQNFARKNRSATHDANNFFNQCVTKIFDGVCVQPKNTPNRAHTKAIHIVCYRKLFEVN